MKNPPVTGLPCALCFAPAQSFSHIVHRGLGGDPKAKRTDGFPACGSGGSHDLTCHGQISAGRIKVRRRKGTLQYRPDGRAAQYLRSKQVSCKEDAWNDALYEHSTFDERGMGA